MAPGGNNLANICYKDFLGLSTINYVLLYYYYYQGNQGKRINFCENQGILDSAWSLSRINLDHVFTLGKNFRHLASHNIHLLRIEFLPKFWVYIVHHLREIREFSCKFGLKNQGKSGNLFVKSC